jgi:hypothetical protein
MKKLSLLICLIFSCNSFATCEAYYQKVAQKRVRTVMYISYGIGLISPALVLIGGGVVMTTIVLAGGFANGKFNELNKRLTTFGKVNIALTGDPKQLGKKVAKYLKWDGIIVDQADPEFLVKIRNIAQELNESEKACPYLGYDKKFQDIVKLYNFRDFSKMVKEEYIKSYINGP